MKHGGQFLRFGNGTIMAARIQTGHAKKKNRHRSFELQSLWPVIIFFAALSLLFVTASHGQSTNRFDFNEVKLQIEKLLKDKKYKSALERCKEVLTVAESNFGQKDPRYAQLLILTSKSYDETKQLDEGLKACERAVSIYKEVFGETSLEYAGALDDLARHYRYANASQIPKAIEWYGKAFEIRKKVLGEEKVDAGDYYDKLGDCYFWKSHYKESEPYYLKELEYYEKNREKLPTQKPLAIAYANIGYLAMRLDEEYRAATYFQKAVDVAVQEKSFTPAELIEYKIQLALSYRNTNTSAKADPIYRELIQELKQEREKNPKDEKILKTYIDVLIAYAGLFTGISDHPHAIKLLDEAALECQRNLQVSGVRWKLLHLGEIYMYANRSDVSLKLCLQLKEHYDSKKERGNGYVGVLEHLAMFYRSLDRYEDALKTMQLVLEILLKVDGPNKDSTAIAYRQLAHVYSLLDKDAQAIEYYEKALGILKHNHKEITGEIAYTDWFLGSAYKDVDDFKKARVALQECVEYDLEHTEHLNNVSYRHAIALAKVCYELNDLETVRMLAEKLYDSDLFETNNVLSFSSERARLDYQNYFSPFSTYELLGDGKALANMALQFKGLILDSLLEDAQLSKTSSNPELHALVETLQEKKKTLSSIKEPSSKNNRETHETILSLNEEIENTESEIARRVSTFHPTRRALKVKWEDVHKSIPKDAVLIEIINENVYKRGNKHGWDFGAVVIPHQGEPRWTRIGCSADINKLTKLYRRAAEDGSSDESFSSILSALYQMVWSPIETILPRGTRTIIISPDGNLNFLSFAILLNRDGRFLSEDYSIRYVASGRDLLVNGSTGKKHSVSIFANPDFGNNESTFAASRTTTRSSKTLTMPDLMKTVLPSLNLKSLPGTQKEMKAVAGVFESLGWNVKTFESSSASKENLFNQEAPEVLHLATHGFYIDIKLPKKNSDTKREDENEDEDESEDSSNRILNNPMHKSGFILSGAHQTMEAWKTGRSINVQNDGIITADQVALMDLHDTWLVTISACESGAGEARSGEGILGLRRGFLQTGAQNLLMTLWKIDDQQTVPFMESFYKAAAHNGNASQSFADTQRDWLLNVRKEKGLTEAVKTAGAFILNFQGKP